VSVGEYGDGVARVQLCPLPGDLGPYRAGPFGRSGFADGLPGMFEERIAGDDDDGPGQLRGRAAADAVDDGAGFRLRQRCGQIADRTGESGLDGALVDFGDDDLRIDAGRGQDLSAGRRLRGQNDRDHEATAGGIGRGPGTRSRRRADSPFSGTSRLRSTLTGDSIRSAIAASRVDDSCAYPSSLGNRPDSLSRDFRFVPLREFVARSGTARAARAASHWDPARTREVRRSEVLSGSRSPGRPPRLGQTRTKTV